MGGALRLWPLHFVQVAWTTEGFLQCWQCLLRRCNTAYTTLIPIVRPTPGPSAHAGERLRLWHIIGMLSTSATPSLAMLSTKCLLQEKVASIERETRASMLQKEQSVGSLTSERNAAEEAMRQAREDAEAAAAEAQELQATVAELRGVQKEVRACIAWSAKT